jgi:hypothetical protein
MMAENFDQVLSGLRGLQPVRIFRRGTQWRSTIRGRSPGALVVHDGIAVFLAPGGVPVWFDHERVLRIVGAGSGIDA